MEALTRDDSGGFGVRKLLKLISPLIFDHG